MSDSAPSKGALGSAASSLSGHIDQNVASLVALQKREWEMTSPSQRRVERISRIIGRPLFLIGMLTFVVLWIGGNLVAQAFGGRPLDPPPFPFLEGVLTLIALFMTTIVLIAQNRQTKVEQQHTHLGLQVNILTEQKVTKLIDLIEELRRDLPMVRNRLDPQAEVLRAVTDTAEVLSAIQGVGLADHNEIATKGKSSENKHDP
jgi:uncharacterized membrane protein